MYLEGRAISSDPPPVEAFYCVFVFASGRMSFGFFLLFSALFLAATCGKIIPNHLFTKLEGEACGWTRWCAGDLVCAKGELHEDGSDHTCVMPYSLVVVGPKKPYSQLFGGPCSCDLFCTKDLVCKQTKKWGKRCMPEEPQPNLVCPANPLKVEKT
ncbi:unnamed protein product [Caenorhabditis auriculariae]|uniref:Uncharacterized protein n=1 Tax=Caenorhabditis auriculariae TaxID=2777116 RepID=A0A8S1GZT3_9PELO|nr:unnamed protein product [Caenorhabditis auriculariae]